ncbi:MAG: hypothetical protein ACR2PT_04750, partial [Endozoicomonas sp.]
LMLPDYQNPVKAGPLAFLSGSGMPALPPTELYMAPTLAQRMSLESLMHSCPTGGGRNAKKPSAKKGASAVTGQAESDSHHRTVQEICVDYINDAGSDYWNTVHNKGWLLSAFQPFVERFTPRGRTPENIGVQFIEDLTHYTLEQLNVCKEMLPHLVVSIQGKKAGSSYITRIAAFQKTLGKISFSKRGQVQYIREAAKFPGKFQFQIYSFLSSNTLTWLQKLLDLLCLTYDESYPGSEGSIKTLLGELGLIHKVTSEAGGGQIFSAAAPWRVNQLEKVVATADLLRAMRDFYSDKPRVYKEFEEIAGLDGAPPPGFIDQFHSLALDEMMAYSALHASEGATASGPFMQASQPISSDHIRKMPKKNPINTLKDAIRAEKVKEAKQIYIKNKREIEKQAKWKDVKRPFRRLLREKGETDFVLNHHLE